MILRFLRRLWPRPKRQGPTPVGEQPPIVVAAPGDVPRVPDGAHGRHDIGGATMPTPPPPPPPRVVVMAPSPPPALVPPPPPPAPPAAPVAEQPPPPSPLEAPDADAHPEGENHEDDSTESTVAHQKTQIRLLLSDGTVTAPTGDPHLLDRLAYLADNLFPEDEGRSNSE